MQLKYRNIGKHQTQNIDLPLFNNSWTENGGVLGAMSQRFDGSLSREAVIGRPVVVGVRVTVVWWLSLARRQLSGDVRW